MPHPLPQKTVVITGASSGIGRASALRLAKRPNTHLVLNGQNPDTLNTITHKCREYAQSVHAALGDIRSPKTLDQIRTHLKTSPTPLHLVNAAGIGSFGPTDEYSEEQWNKLISTNLTGCMLSIQAVLPFMLQSQSPFPNRIINVGSDADHIGFSEAAAYCASKAGLLGMSRAMQAELTAKNISVTVLSPGRVDTHFNDKKPGMRPGALLADDVAEAIDFIIHCSPRLELQKIEIESMQRFNP